MAKTEIVSAERLEHLRANPEHINPRYELPAIVALGLTALRAANSDGGVEPVAWFIPPDANGEYRQVANQYFGEPDLIPLYAHPPAKSLDGIAVTDEMVERAARKIATIHYAERFSLAYDDQQVSRNVDANWIIFDNTARAALTAALK